jgi:hypothetical protein
LRVQSVGYNVTRRQEIHVGHYEHYGRKHFKYFLMKVIGKHGKKDIGGCWKGPKKSFAATKVQKMKSWMLKILLF